MGLLLDIGNAINDGLSWAETLLIRISTQFNSNTNEHAVLIHGVFNATSATQSYQKDLLQVWGKTHDPSKPGVAPYAVATDFRNGIAAGNPSGFSHTNYMEGFVEAGGDGTVVVSERGGNNNGTDSAPYGNPLSKGIDLIVASESPNNKNQEYFRAVTRGYGNGRFQHGDIIDREAMVAGAPIYELIDTNEPYPWKPWLTITSDGVFRGRHSLPPVINTSGLDPKQLPADMEKGELFVWGDTQAGQSYLAYYDGQGYALTQTTYIR